MSEDREIDAIEAEMDRMYSELLVTTVPYLSEAVAKEIVQYIDSNYMQGSVACSSLAVKANRTARVAEIFCASAVAMLKKVKNIKKSLDEYYIYRNEEMGSPPGADCIYHAVDPP